MRGGQGGRQRSANRTLRPRVRASGSLGSRPSLRGSAPSSGLVGGARGAFYGAPAPPASRRVRLRSSVGSKSAPPNPRHVHSLQPVSTHSVTQSEVGRTGVPPAHRDGAKAGGGGVAVAHKNPRVRSGRPERGGGATGGPVKHPRGRGRERRERLRMACRRDGVARTPAARATCATLCAVKAMKGRTSA